MDTAIVEQAAPVLAALTATCVLEALVPLRAQAQSGTRLRVNISLIAMTLALGAALNGGLAACALLASSHGLGLLATLPGGGIVDLLLGVVVLDFAAYAAHVAMHRSELLWRIHQVHHLDTAVDASTSLRQHPLEGLVRAGFAVIAIVVGGVSPAAVALGRLLSALNAVFEHANVRTPRALDRVLGLVWVTPAMHKLHHAHDRSLADSNYANLLALFDRVFGTWTSPRALAPLRYGIAGCEEAHALGLGTLLLLPFRRTVAPLAPARHAA